ncbi:hypothetical protein [Sphingomonas sp. ACRSK]|uniref:hypothetical protein n=1 Tax=Sphingomonas sp. ACRSK TaxID=2918213 RepID=UPI001EF5404F|nr:hypothetical protein [Sphingomonas sp. ACRSK]MCG7348816.1 hypothetical protein [Sphingomonas sp. ACRSK]
MGKRSELTPEERRQAKNEWNRRYRKEKRDEVTRRQRERYALDPEKFRAEKARSDARPNVAERRRERGKKRYEKDRDRMLAQEQLRRAANRDERNYRRRQRWAEDPEYRQARYDARNSRMARDPAFRVAQNLRVRLCMALKNQQKAGSAVDDLGCTIPELMAHLERRFLPGMTWANWSRHGWHIDHIKPLASFDLTDREQFLAACHYTNLQPLWAVDNLRKGDR